MTTFALALFGIAYALVGIVVGGVWLQHSDDYDTDNAVLVAVFWPLSVFLWALRNALEVVAGIVDVFRGRR